MSSLVPSQPRRAGRYLLLGEFASGGMAVVHLGKLLGDAGFQREVAIKQLQPNYAKDPVFVSMMLDEARITSRVQHPHVAQVLDVVAEGGELFIVMELVHGDSLASLLRAARAAGQGVEPGIAVAVAIDALHGLHAAHLAVDDGGAPLQIVHRDVSPHNIMVGVDGRARVVDFGVAKALGRSSSTQDGEIKGKLAYMAPEHATGGEVDGRSDLYALAVVLWEMLAGRRLYDATSQIDLYRRAAQGVSEGDVQLAHVNPELQAVLVRALQREPAMRYESAEAMAQALERTRLRAPSPAVTAWVQSLAADRLATLSSLLRRAKTEVEPRAPTTEATASAIVVQAATPPPEDLTVSLAKPPRRGRRAGAVAVAVFALGGVGALAWLWSGAQAPQPQQQPPAVSVVEPTPPPDPTPSLVEETKVAPVVPPPELLVAKPAGRGSKPRVSKVKKTAVEAANTTDAESCDPPYVLDADGNRTFKRQCLTR